MFLHKVGPIFLQYLLEAQFFWKICLKKTAFLFSKLGNGPLLEHGPVIEIFTLWEKNTCLIILSQEYSFALLQRLARTIIF